MPKDNYIVTLSGRPCKRCGQPFDWHDEEPPHIVPRQSYDDDCVDEGCEGYVSAEPQQKKA